MVIPMRCVALLAAISIIYILLEKQKPGEKKKPFIFSSGIPKSSVGVMKDYKIKLEDLKAYTRWNGGGEYLNEGMTS